MDQPWFTNPVQLNINKVCYSCWFYSFTACTTAYKQLEEFISVTFVCTERHLDFLRISEHCWIVIAVTDTTDIKFSALLQITVIQLLLQFKRVGVNVSLALAKSFQLYCFLTEHKKLRDSTRGFVTNSSFIKCKVIKEFIWLKSISWWLIWHFLVQRIAKLTCN